MSNLEFDHLDLDEGFVQVPGKCSQISQKSCRTRWITTQKQACEPEFCVSMPGFSPLDNMTTRNGKN